MSNRRCKNASQEFEFLRDKLENVAKVFMEIDSRASLVEVAFTLGCLQNICNDNYLFFKEEDE